MKVYIYPTHKNYITKTHAALSKYTHAYLHVHYEDIKADNHIPQTGKKIAYIIDSITLKIKDFLEFEEYEFKRDIDYEDKSSITVLRQPNASTDDYVLCKCGGDTIFTGIYKDYSAESNSSEYKITLLQKEKLFDRFVFVKNESVISATGVEDFIANTITDNWISSGDSMTDKPYISVEALTHTPIYAKVSTTVDLTDGCFNLKTYLGNCLEYYGIRVEFEITQDALTVYIANDAEETVKVNANDTDVADYSEVYAVDALTKLSVRFDKKENDAIASSTDYEYYLRNDRTITTDKTDTNRAKGSSKAMVIEAESEAEMYQKVQDEFSGNSYSHKISFNMYMDSKIYDYIDCYIGRSCMIKTKSGVRTSLVTSTSVSNESRFADIELGKLKVTLIEKIRSMT